MSKSETVVMDMVLIQAGSFVLGSEYGREQAAPNEMPQQTVVLPDFCLGRYPVTNALYAAYVQETGVAAPSHWQGKQPPPGLATHPVTNVTTLEAGLYCQWLSEKNGHTYRLPTEQEWEKAARGAYPNKRIYVWGSEWRANYCNTKEAGLGETTAVDHFATTNHSPYGIVDLLGNVWEWTSTLYSTYPNSVYQSSTREHYVVRGGCWDYGAEMARVSCRGRYQPNTRRPYLGFRLAAEPIYRLDTAVLADLLRAHFNLSEMYDLCSQLGFTKDDIPHRTRTEMIPEFVDYLKRHSLTAVLYQEGATIRSDVPWKKAYTVQAPRLFESNQ